MDTSPNPRGMKTRRRWTEEAITNELEPIVAELGRLPTRRELTERGLGGMASAMQRQGGTAVWRARLAAAPTPSAEVPAPPSREAIALRAYFLAQERGGDPLRNWLDAEAQLLAA
jgi:hypothetical protein